MEIVVLLQYLDRVILSLPEWRPSQFYSFTVNRGVGGGGWGWYRPGTSLTEVSHCRSIRIDTRRSLAITSLQNLLTSCASGSYLYAKIQARNLPRKERATGSSRSGHGIFGSALVLQS